MRVPGNPYANAPGNEDVPVLIVDVRLPDLPVSDEADEPSDSCRAGEAGPAAPKTTGPVGQGL